MDTQSANEKIIQLQGHIIQLQQDAAILQREHVTLQRDHTSLQREYDNLDQDHRRLIDEVESLKRRNSLLEGSHSITNRLEEGSNRPPSPRSTPQLDPEPTASSSTTTAPTHVLPPPSTTSSSSAITNTRTNNPEADKWQRPFHHLAMWPTTPPSGPFMYWKPVWRDDETREEVLRRYEDLDKLLWPNGGTAAPSVKTAKRLASAEHNGEGLIEHEASYLWLVWVMHHAHTHAWPAEVFKAFMGQEFNRRNALCSKLNRAEKKANPSKKQRTA